MNWQLGELLSNFVSKIMKTYAFPAIVLWDSKTCFSRNSHFRWAITVLVMLLLQISLKIFHILRIHRWAQVVWLRLCMIGCHCRISKIAFVNDFFFFLIYINDLHNIQITTDQHNHQIPWYSRENWDQIKIK